MNCLAMTSLSMANVFGFIVGVILLEAFLTYVFQLSIRLANRFEHKPIDVPSFGSALSIVVMRQCSNFVLATGLLTIGELLTGQEPPPDQLRRSLAICSVLMNTLFGSWLLSRLMECRFVSGLRIVLIAFFLQLLIALGVVFVVFFGMYLLKEFGS
jgi:hypothetical protein